MTTETNHTTNNNSDNQSTTTSSSVEDYTPQQNLRNTNNRREQRGRGGGRRGRGRRSDRNNTRSRGRGGKGNRGRNNHPETTLMFVPKHQNESDSSKNNNDNSQDKFNKRNRSQAQNSDSFQNKQSKSRKNKRKPKQKDSKSNSTESLDYKSQNQYSAFSKKKRNNFFKQNRSNSNRKPIRLQNINFTGFTPRSVEMIEQLNNQQYECMICTEYIKHKDPIWNCTSCHRVFHLNCIKKWYKSQIQSEDSNNNSTSLSWTCPACNYAYSNKSRDVPNEYKCFCGSTIDPPFDPMIGIAHSCGNTCERKRLDTPCPHPCTLPCHPGPCPPCPHSRRIPCFCGKRNFVVNCSDPIESKSCGAICGHLLNCEKHQCNEICHEGRCKPCDEEYSQTCYCGAVTEIRKCTATKREIEEDGTERSFGCGSICNKVLSCGKHRCKRQCHPGNCGECSLSPSIIKACPCGKCSIKELLPEGQQRNSCDDPIPTCDQLCSKKLPCGRHKCKQSCHQGSCGHCTEMTNVKCLCRNTSAKVPCFVAYRFKPSPSENIYKNFAKDPNIDDDTRASLQATASEYPQVPLVCNRKCKTSLHCGRHRCQRVCCPGRGQQEWEGHRCTKKCNRKLSCGNHRCHETCHPGPCPPCLNAVFSEISCKCGKTVLEPPQPCGTPPPTCRHPCTAERPCGHPTSDHRCHFGPCPPCMHLVDKQCVGGHMTVKRVRCCATNISCGHRCRKTLPCGIHKCKRICHDGPCLQDGLPEEHRRSCGQTCRRKLPCNHLCRAKCHLDEPCPDQNCPARVDISCACHHRTEASTCYKVKQMLKERGHEPSPFGIEVSLPPLLECTAECKRAQFLSRLREALDVEDRERIPLYYENLIKFAQNNPAFAKNIEKQFAELIHSNDKKTIHFEVMNREKRSFIHDLGEFYDISTVAVDREPQRSVIATKHDHSSVPDVVLTSVASNPKLIEFVVEETAKQEAELEGRHVRQDNYARTSSSINQKETHSKNNNAWDEAAGDAQASGSLVFQEDGESTVQAALQKQLPVSVEQSESTNMWQALDEE